MSMGSEKSSQIRRVPQRARGSHRVSSILNAAAEVFAEVGYEAATMKEFAKRANSSIGSIYQYFADKDAVVRAIRLHYVEEMERRWQPLAEQITDLPLEVLVDRSVDLLISFIEEHPAYIPLLTARRNAASGDKTGLDLRKRFAVLLRSRRPDLPEGTVLQIVNVTLQVLKGLDALYARAKRGDRPGLVREVKLMLTAYLRLRLEVKTVARYADVRRHRTHQDTR